MGYLTGLLDALHVPAEARAKLLDFLRAKTPTSCEPPRWPRGWTNPPLPR